MVDVADISDSIADGDVSFQHGERRLRLESKRRLLGEIRLPSNR